MASDANLLALDPVSLRDAVRMLLRREDAEVVAWEASSRHHAINAVTDGLYRLTGTARVQGVVVSWALVLKILRRTIAEGVGVPVSGDEPTMANYWKREALIYESGLLEHLAPGIASSHRYGIDQPTPDLVWIWLENVARRRADGAAETVEIDWAFAGLGAIGEDLAPMIFADVFFCGRDPGEVRALDAQVFAGYVAGLRDAGWTGDVWLVRLGYTAAAPLRYVTLPFWTVLLSSAAIEKNERRTGIPVEESLRKRAALWTFRCNQAREARVLMQVL